MTSKQGEKYYLAYFLAFIPMKLCVYLEARRAHCGFWSSETSEWEVFVFLEDWECVGCVSMHVWGQKRLGNCLWVAVILQSCMAQNSVLMKLLFFFFFSIDIVDSRIRQCLREDVEVGKQIPTLLWMLCLCLSFKSGSLLPLMTDIHTVLPLSGSFLFYCFLFKGNWKKLRVRIYPNTCSVSEAQWIGSREVKEAGSSKCLLPFTTHNAMQLEFIGVYQEMYFICCVL